MIYRFRLSKEQHDSYRSVVGAAFEHVAGMRWFGDVNEAPLEAIRDALEALGATVRQIDVFAAQAARVSVRMSDPDRWDPEHWEELLQQIADCLACTEMDVWIKKPRLVGKSGSERYYTVPEVLRVEFPERPRIH